MLVRTWSIVVGDCFLVGDRSLVAVVGWLLVLAWSKSVGGWFLDVVGGWLLVLRWRCLLVAERKWLVVGWCFRFTYKSTRISSALYSTLVSIVISYSKRKQSTSSWPQIHAVGCNR